MTAVVLPFPVRRRLSFIERQAEVAAELGRPAAAKQYIDRQLQLQATTMRRKGVSEQLIGNELVSMENAICALLSRWFQSGGVA